MRCLTYFFVWLAPPRSVLPARPPTETLASFFLACGGLIFMLSTEEVMHAAMRRGRDGERLHLPIRVGMTDADPRYDGVLDWGSCDYVLRHVLGSCCCCVKGLAPVAPT